MNQEIGKSRPSDVQVRLGGLPSLLLKSVEHVHSLRKLRYEKDAMLRGRVDPNLNDSWPNRWHWLPVCRHKATLNLIQLESRPASGIDREASEPLAAVPDECEGLQAHDKIY